MDPPEPSGNSPRERMTDKTSFGCFYSHQLSKIGVFKCSLTSSVTCSELRHQSGDVSVTPNFTDSLFLDLLSPHVEELLADLLVLLLHAQLSRFALWGQLGEQEVTVFLEKPHPAQVLHALAGSCTTQRNDISRKCNDGSTTTRVQWSLFYRDGALFALNYDLENVL